MSLWEFIGLFQSGFKLTWKMANFVVIIITGFYLQDYGRAMVYSYKNLWDYFGMGLNQVFIFMGKWQILGLLHYYGF